MKYILFISFCIMCNNFANSQNLSIQNVLDSVSKKEYCINKKIKVNGNILTSKIESKNYFLKFSSKKIILFHLLTIDDLFVFYIMDNEMYNATKKNYRKNIENSVTTGINSDILIYNNKTKEFIYLANNNSNQYLISKNKGLFFRIFFDISLPIVFRDSNFEFKYCFFNTSKESENNIAFYEFIKNRNYSQINIYGQSNLKNINVLDLDINKIKNIYLNDKKLIRKENYNLIDIKIFNIYRQIILNKLKKFDGEIDAF